MSHVKHTCGVGLMELLRDYDTDLIFGIPGVHTLELYRGIAESGIRHITPRHEQAAGFMADGYARATGKPGVCCLITGPGVTNAATALAQSYSDSVPVLCISSVNKTASLELGQGDLHEVRSQGKLTEHFTAFSQTVLATATIPEIVSRAFAVFDASRPRPVHIEIPIDLIEQPVTWSSTATGRTEPPHASQPLLLQAAQLLATAKCPVLILGGGSKDATVEANQVVDLLNIPVVTTVAGKGVVPETHALSLGASLQHPQILDFVRQADVVLVVGSHLSETDIWCHGGDIEFDGKLIRIDLEPSQLYQNALPHLAIVGDARHALGQIASLLESMVNTREGQFEAQQQRVCNLTAQCQSNGSELIDLHLEIWNQIRSALPPDGIVTADSTQLVYSGNHLFCAQRPRTYLTSTTGYGTLGYALPAAIGAQLGKPQTPVVCVVGDGGMMFTIQELATAVEHQLPIVIVLWHNDGYGEIRDNFKRDKIPLVGVDLNMPDFVATAKGFGCRAKRVGDVGELAKLLKQGFAEKGPTLLELRQT